MVTSVDFSCVALNMFVLINKAFLTNMSPQYHLLVILHLETYLFNELFTVLM